MSEVMSPFEMHTGFPCRESGHDNKITTCPFCEKEDHLYFNKTNFLWDCKVCGKSGNALDFVRMLYDEFNNKTEAANELSIQRGVPASYFQKVGVKFNTINKSYLIPTRKNGKLSQLYKAFQVYDSDKGKMVWRILATAGLDQQLFDYPETTADKLLVAEGHWDRIAADAIIGSRDMSAVGVPGANNWDDSWTRVLGEKHVIFCYDNDEPGQKGFEKVILNKIAKSPVKPKSISYIKWPEDLPKGFDLNDAYRKWGKATWGALEKFIKPYEAPSNVSIVKTTIETVAEDTSCDSYDKLLDVFKTVFYTTPDMEKGLALVLASIYSVRSPMEQIWVRLIGPPSSGKTTIAKCVSGSERVKLMSTFTGLYSGWKDDSDDDAGLIPEISGRTLVVKDADALLRQANVEKIFSELRDFYDKDASVQYKNRVKHDYRNIHCTMVLCGTNSLRRADNAFLGERFLDFELRLSDDDRNKISERAIDNTIRAVTSGDSLTPETAVIAAGKGFINHLTQRELKTKIDQKTMSYIDRLSKLACALRSKVDRDMGGRGEVTFTPVQESPARLAGQLTKLCLVLPVVFNTEIPDERTHHILFKVVRDIIDPSCNRYKICMELVEGWFTPQQLHNQTEISVPVLSRELSDLKHLDILETKKEPNGQGVGRFTTKITLKDVYKEALILSMEHED